MQKIHFSKRQEKLDSSFIVWLHTRCLFVRDILFFVERTPSLNLRHSYIMSETHDALQKHKATHMMMCDLPLDIVRYQLCPFLTSASALELTQASPLLFHALRRSFHRKAPVTTDDFIQQNDSQSKLVGLCSSVSVENVKDLTRLLQHIHHPSSSNKLLNTSLLRMRLDLDEPLCINNIVFPTTLRYLTFGCMLQQPIAGIVLPQNLHTLVFGWIFDQSLSGITLPASLHTLKFGSQFNQSLSETTLPANLHTLKFGSQFNRSLSETTLPANLHT